MKEVAIFDIDGTIFRSSLLIEIVEALTDAGLFPKDARKDYEKEYIRWLNREDDYEKYIHAVVRAYMRHIKGVSYAAFMDIVDEMIAREERKVYRYTRGLIRDLKDADYYLLAISQSPKSVIDKFCKHLGFNKTYGRIYELGPQNLFTGAIVDEHIIMNKANIVKRAVEKERLTMENSVGVGDSEDDIPVLEMVDRPICFNPNDKLYRHAKLNSWKVVVERKNVIYEM